MTAYEQGFIMKCAEYGIDESTSINMLKYAGPRPQERQQVQSMFNRNSGAIQQARQANQNASVPSSVTSGFRQAADLSLRTIPGGGFGVNTIPNAIKDIQTAGSWAGRNWDRYIKPIGSAAVAYFNPIGGAISGYRRGGLLSAIRGAIDPAYRARHAYQENSNPGMQPVQPGAKAIQQNGKIVNPREIAERYAKQHGWNTNPDGQQQQPAQPSQSKLTTIQQQAQDYQNGVNKQIADQQAANKARAAEQARLDAEWRAKHPASGTSQQAQTQPPSNPVNPVGPGGWMTNASVVNARRNGQPAKPNSQQPTAPQPAPQPNATAGAKPSPNVNPPQGWAGFIDRFGNRATVQSGAAAEASRQMAEIDRIIANRNNASRNVAGTPTIRHTYGNPSSRITTVAQRGGNPSMGQFQRPMARGRRG